MMYVNKRNDFQEKLLFFSFYMYLMHAWQNATCDSVEYAIILSANTSITVERNDNLKKKKEKKATVKTINFVFIITI